MFKKFQEYTLKFFYDLEPSSELTFFDTCFILLIFAEIISPFVWLYFWIKNGLTPINTIWISTTTVFWLSLITGYCASKNKNYRFETDVYDELSIPEKRYIFKLSIVLFILFSSCGIMIVMLPIIIIVGTFNIILTSVSKRVFPDPVKKKTSNELSNEYDSLIKD